MTLYLDQCAAGYLIGANKGSASWMALREVLEKGFAENRLLCPMPLETLAESAAPGFGRENRIKMEELFTAIGGGTTFKDFYTILEQETLNLVRPTRDFTPYCKPPPRGWGTRDDAASRANANYRQALSSMAERIRVHREVPCPPGDEQLGRWQVFESVARERSRTFEGDLLRLGNGATDGFEIPWLTQWIAESRLSPGELDLLLERVRDQTWQFTGVNLVDLIVGSQWDYDHLQGWRAKYKANDEIDRWRAAVALCWSDLLITDGPAATLLKSSNVSAFTTPIVYSVKDVDAILQFLTSR